MFKHKKEQHCRTCLESTAGCGKDKYIIYYTKILEFCCCFSALMKKQLAALNQIS